MNNNIEQMVFEAKCGNQKSLENLLKIIQQDIIATLYYLKTEHSQIKDLTQEIMLKVTKKIGQLKNINSFKTWLNQIIINSYYDYLRKVKKYKNEVYLENLSKPEILEIPDYSTNPQDDILNSELDYIIKNSINNLPIHYKIPIALREIQGLSYDEISSITKTTVGTIKSRIARARAIIKDCVIKYSRG